MVKRTTPQVFSSLPYVPLGGGNCPKFLVILWPWTSKYPACHLYDALWAAPAGKLRVISNFDALLLVADTHLESAYCVCCSNWWMMDWCGYSWVQRFCVLLSQLEIQTSSIHDGGLHDHACMMEASEYLRLRWRTWGVGGNRKTCQERLTYGRRASQRTPQSQSLLWHCSKFHSSSHNFP